MIKIRVDIYSDWHIGSGVGEGAYADAIPLKDTNGFPYLPGKTLKGLLRDNSIVLSKVDSRFTNEMIEDLYGMEAANGLDAYVTGSSIKILNATLSEGDMNSFITDGKFSKSKIKQLFRRYTFTKIDGETGVIEDASLRNLEFVIPLTLESTLIPIKELNALQIELIEKSALMVRSLGMLRNKGFGKCSIKIIK